jgi:hypothetical protein
MNPGRRFSDASLIEAKLRAGSGTRRRRLHRVFITGSGPETSPVRWASHPHQNRSRHRRDPGLPDCDQTLRPRFHASAAKMSGRNRVIFSAQRFRSQFWQTNGTNHISWRNCGTRSRQLSGLLRMILENAPRAAQQKSGNNNTDYSTRQRVCNEPSVKLEDDDE